MRTDSHVDTGKEVADISPLRRDIRSRGSWNYLGNYVLLGSSALILLTEIIRSGMLLKLWAPLAMIVVAITNIARLQASERKPAEPSASPNDGPVKPVVNSGAKQGA